MDNRTKVVERALGDIAHDAWWAVGTTVPSEKAWDAAEAVRIAVVAELENFLASPILGITLGPDLEGKITEQEALDLVNASRLCLLAGVRAIKSPKEQGAPDEQ